MVMFTRLVATAAALATFAAVASPASAALNLVTTQTDDNAFEGPGGFLQTYYGLPLVPPANTTALPPIERAVGEVRIGRPAGNSERTRGFHVPNAISGIPGIGNGVTAALTNHGSLPTQTPPAAINNVTTNWFSPYSSAMPNDSGLVAFSIGRTGNTLRYSVGTNVWEDTKSYYADVNGVEIRLASQSDRTNSIDLFNVTYTAGANPAQLLGSFNAVDGTKLIKLYDGIAGNFSITGEYQLKVSGALPGASGLASQIKLLELPPATVPEPASWAMLIAGFGLTGAAMRRRRTVVA